ncbi:MAG: sigma-70 family RNA polymerase sigma factor [Planctomycetota bacterium]
MATTLPGIHHAFAMTEPSPPTIQALLDQHEWVRRLARRLVGDLHEAEDLAQETLTVALERPPQDTAKVRSWLSQVLANLHRQRVRRQRPAPLERADDEPLEGLAPDGLVARAEVHHLLVREVLALDEPYRTTILLRYFEGLGPRAIADRTSVPLATVTSRLTRAHARLRDRVERTRTDDGRTNGLAALALLAAPRASAPAAPSALVLMSTSSKIAAAVLVVATFGIAGVLIAQRTSDDGAPVDVQRASAPSGDVVELGTTAPRPAARTSETVESSAAPAAAPAAASTRLEGLVVDASGAPAIGAHVALGGHGSLIHLLFDDEPEEGTTVAITDDQGRFAFDAAPTGTLLVTAGARDAAPSETQRVELEEGAVVDDVVLQLRRGARVHGEVVRSDGSLARGRKVRFMQDDESADAQGRRLSLAVETDELGRYDARNLFPGSWTFVSFPEEEELAEIGGTMPENMAQAAVRLEDGEERFIVLGARSSEAVVVSGRVSLDGAAADGFLQWIGECDDPMGSQKVAELDGDGRYRVELPLPGAWYVRAMGSVGSGDFYVDIPAIDEFEQDLDLPSGGMEGRVLDAAGDPVEGAWVTHQLVGGGTQRHVLRLADDVAQTEADGAFQFGGLLPGTYQIGVVQKELGSASVGSLVVTEDATLGGLEIVLESGHSIEGRIVGPDGLPKPKVPVWVHGPGGDLIEPISRTTTNDDGRYRTPKLAPGTYSVLASTGLFVAQAVGVEVEDAGVEGVDLQLAPGATLVIEARTDEGELQRAQVRVDDRDGRTMTGLRSLFDPWTWRRLPFDSRRRHVGPFPAGTYVVTASVPDAGSASTNVTLQPGERREVTLPLR